MARLVIKNIGPITNVDIELNKVNVFIGPPSSGKSTISKILCHCQWVEKTCCFDDKELKHYEKKEVFFESLIEYHRLDGYFNKLASIKYYGDYLTIIYTHSSRNIRINKTKNKIYSYPKISYIPSERNLVAAIPNFGKYNEGNDVILYFGYDWVDAKNAIPKKDMSNLLERNIVYKSINGGDYIYDGDRRILLTNASSGILSLLPLYLVLSYMCDVLYTKDRALSSNKRAADQTLNETLVRLVTNMKSDNFKASNFKESIDLLIKVSASLNSHSINPITDFSQTSKDIIADTINNIIIESRRLFDYKYTQLFIEEPEQNLFPKAQMKFVNELFILLNDTERAHSAVITTHSPFVVFAINNCIMRSIVKGNITENMKAELLDNKALIDPKDISIYQIDNGALVRIQDEDGNLDENFINDAYKENSAEYFSLLNFYKDEE